MLLLGPVSVRGSAAASLYDVSCCVDPVPFKRDATGSTVGSSTEATFQSTLWNGYRPESGLPARKQTQHM